MSTPSPEAPDEAAVEAPRAYTYTLTLTPAGVLEVNDAVVEVPDGHRNGVQPLRWALGQVNDQHCRSSGQELTLVVYDERSGGRGKTVTLVAPGEVVDVDALAPSPAGRTPVAQRATRREDRESQDALRRPPSRRVTPDAASSADLRSPVRLEPTEPTEPPDRGMPAEAETQREGREEAARNELPAIARPPTKVVQLRVPPTAAVERRPSPESTAKIVKYSWQRSDLVEVTPSVPRPLLSDQPDPPRVIMISRTRAAMVAVALLVAMVLAAGFAFARQSQEPQSAVCVEVTTMTRMSAAHGCQFPRQWWYVPPGQPLPSIGGVVATSGAFTAPTGRVATLDDDEPRQDQ